MNVEDFREYCLSKKGVTESFPFDNTTLVFKVAGKMFALTSLDTGFRVSLKCDPELAVSLREIYAAVTPAWHMNKTHWNMVVPDEAISDEMLIGWTDHSYDMVCSKLSAREKKMLESLP